MKITDFENEDAVELMADILEPAVEIISDKKIQKVFNGEKYNKLETVKYLLKEHKKSIVEIMAAMQGVPVEEYRFNIITGTSQILDLLNDPELIRFFQSLGQTQTKNTSGSVTEITTETEKK